MAPQRNVRVEIEAKKTKLYIRYIGEDSKFDKACAGLHHIKHFTKDPEVFYCRESDNTISVDLECIQPHVRYSAGKYQITIPSEFRRFKDKYSGVLDFPDIAIVLGFPGFETVYGDRNDILAFDRDHSFSPQERVIEDLTSHPSVQLAKNEHYQRLFSISFDDNFEYKEWYRCMFLSPYVRLSSPRWAWGSFTTILPKSMRFLSRRRERKSAGEDAEKNMDTLE